MAKLESIREWLRGKPVDGLPDWGNRPRSVLRHGAKPTPGWTLQVGTVKFDVIDFKLESKFEDREELLVQVRFDVDTDPERTGDIASELATLEEAVRNRGELIVSMTKADGTRFVNWKRSWIERVERYRGVTTEDFVFVFKFLLDKDSRVAADGGPLPIPGLLVCEKCGSEDGVAMESSRTMYEWDGKGEDPNRDIALCRPCAKEHHEEWDERWKEYNSGRI